MAGFGLSLFAACAGPQPTPSPRPTPSPTPTPAAAGPMRSPDYAVHVFLWGSPQAERDLRLVKEMGFTWIKQQFEWRYIEPHRKGTFEWQEPDRLVALAERYGLKILARVDNQPRWSRSDTLFPGVGPPDRLEDFADFLTALATRYRGRIQAYEIWNEPNLAREWGNRPPNPTEYVAMLRLAYQAIKKADPQAIVISAGLAPTTASGAVAMPDTDFLRRMYQAGARDFCDVLGVHAAGYKAPPEMSPDEVAVNPRYNHGEPGVGRIYCFRHVEDLRAIMVEFGDAQKQVAVLEMGWTSDTRPGSPYAWHAVTEEEKADYLVRAFQYAAQHWRPWIGVMTVIYIASPTWTRDHEQYYWAITETDGTPRPAYRALQRLPKS